MKQVLSLILFLFLFFINSCSFGDDTETILSRFFNNIYQEKKLKSLRNRITGLLQWEIQNRKLNILSSREKLSEKYRSIELLHLDSVTKNKRKYVYGLIKEFPYGKGYRTTYKTFLAKFLSSRIGNSSDKVWNLYDLIIDNGRKLKNAKRTIKFFKLSKASRSIINNIKNPVNIYIFESDTNKFTTHLIKEIWSHNIDKINVSCLNPYIDRGTAESYGISKPGFTVIERGKIRYVIKSSELIFSKLKTNSRVTSYYEGERILVEAIARVSGINNKLLYLTSHNERDFKNTKFKGTSNFFTEINRFGFSVSTGKITKTVLTNNPVLFFFDPRQNMNKKEYDIVEKFLNKGGRAVFLIEKPVPASFKKLLVVFGLTALNHKIVDPRHKDFWGGPTWIESEVTHNPASINFINRYNLTVLLADSIGFSILKSKKKPLFIPHAVISTYKTGWAEAHFEKGKTDKLYYTEGWDIKGPIPLGYAIKHRKINKLNSGRIILFGDCDFISNQHFLTKQSNWLFFRELINWVSHSGAFKVKPKRYNTSRLLKIY